MSAFVGDIVRTTAEAPTAYGRPDVIPAGARGIVSAVYGTGEVYLDIPVNEAGQPVEWADPNHLPDAAVDIELVVLDQSSIRPDDGPRCESGWTGDRCTFVLGHEGPHSNP